MKSASFLFFNTVVGCITALSGQAVQTNEAAAQSAVSIIVDKGVLSAQFRNALLQEISEILAEKAQINIVLADGVADNLVSLDVSSTVIDVAIRALFAGYDTFLFYGGFKDAPSTLRAVWVFPKGGASNIRPVGPSDWAGTKEIEATLNDADPAVREAAYSALIERPDRHSRRLVTDAISGVRERDSGVRERLLSTALRKKFPLAVDLLTDLVRRDPAEGIRWMALNKLSENPAARWVVEAAMTDSSEEIRSQAKDILQQLSARDSQHRPRSEP